MYEHTAVVYLNHDVKFDKLMNSSCYMGKELLKYNEANPKIYYHPLPDLSINRNKIDKLHRSQNTNCRNTGNYSKCSPTWGPFLFATQFLDMYNLPSSEVDLITRVKKKKLLDEGSSATPSAVPVISSVEFVHQFIHCTAYEEQAMIRA